MTESSYGPLKTLPSLSSIDYPLRAFWLGARYELHGDEGKGWYWQKLSGSEKLQYGEFSAGEPNMKLQSLADSCLIFGSNLEWWDDDCSLKGPYIDTACERPQTGGADSVVG